MKHMRRFEPPPIKWYKLPEQPEPNIDRERYGFNDKEEKVKRMSLFKRVRHELKYQFLWVWRFLFTWNEGKVVLGFYDKDYETCLWQIGED